MKALPGFRIWRGARFIFCWALTAALLAAGVVIEDGFGREVTARGLTLVDWEGFLANPTIRFFVRPPATAHFPATATLSANGPRLYFDQPGTVGAQGPMKTLTFPDASARVAVFLSIFPDRDSLDEDYVLQVHLEGWPDTLMPLHVVDQDRASLPPFNVTVDFTRDVTGFFGDARRRALVTQAAADWAYFIGDMQLLAVPAGAEATYIWDTNAFTTGTFTRNTESYTGFLLYAYGITTPNHRSGGEGSSAGGFQAGAAGGVLPLRRSGGFEAEIHGNYNTLGWLVSTNDDQWWVSGNLGNETNDLYSIAHHEIGHALFFNPVYTRFGAAKTAGGIDDPAVLAYLGRSAAIDAADHFDRIIDPTSLQGVFGYEYFGKFPRKRWLITKCDLLCAQALGYPLRATSALVPLAWLDATLPAAVASIPYIGQLRATGGVPAYNYEIMTGSLPPGLSLDSFTGELSGRPAAAGAYHFTVRVLDSDQRGATNVLRNLELIVADSSGPRFEVDSLSWRTGIFGFQLLGPSGQRQVVQRSTDLATWLPFLTNATGEPRFSGLDLNANDTSPRFYRAVAAP